MNPKRIQRKRTKGWKMPANTVYVGRPTVWGNPWSHKDNPLVQKKGDVSKDWHLVMLHAITVKTMFEDTPEDNALREEFLKPLRGKNLACWCDLDKPCHADTLLGMANKSRKQFDKWLSKEGWIK